MQVDTGDLAPETRIPQGAIILDFGKFWHGKEDARRLFAIKAFRDSNRAQLIRCARIDCLDFNQPGRL